MPIMTTSSTTALVVDDDVISRQMMAFGLEAAGFECSHAIDGNDALAKISRHSFDLVVTDLKMPGRHGHSLAVELLHQTTPPVIAVHTSVDDPRMAEDLMTRGVDDIVYKPTNYAAFAGKMKGLVSRRRHSVDHASESCKTPGPITLAELERRLRDAQHVLPISSADLELSALLAQEGTPLDSLVPLIERDASLCCEVIRVANQAGNVAGRPKAVSLKDAVGVVGTKRIGHVAIVVGALRAFTSAVLPWLDAETARCQGQAAQIALTHLSRLAHWEQPDDGLSISALVHPMGRVLLGTLFPQHYQRMIESFAMQGRTLSEVERSVFPISHTAALGDLLCSWNVPPESVQPLQYVDDSFAAVSRLPQPLQNQVALLKTAVVIGQCASQRWHSWDTVELPPHDVLKMFNVVSTEQLIEDVARELNANETSAEASATKKAAPTKVSKIGYCNLSAPESDLLTWVLSSFAELDSLQTKDSRMMRRGTVINCVGAASAIQLDPNDVKKRELVLVTDGDLPTAISLAGRVIRLPTSYHAIKSACLHAATP